MIVSLSFPIMKYLLYTNTYNTFSRKDTVSANKATGPNPREKQ